MNWNSLLPWILFNAAVVFMLWLDLTVLHKKSHEVKIKEALWQSLLWITIALIFNAGIYFVKGSQLALEFFTAYLLEKSLSIDNLFVFIIVFEYFHIPPRFYHRVLFWGILGALIMRALFILTGIWLIERFHWLIYVFGAFLIYTGIKLAFSHDNEIKPDQNPILKLIRKFFPVSSNVEDERFAFKSGQQWHLTPAFVCLIFINIIDLVFAMDSIPAVMAVSRDSFIVYTSNIFAILGLRALFFAIAGLMKMFEYLNYGLSAVLVFIGGKMLVSHYYHIPIGLSLGVVAGLLGLSIAVSLLPKTSQEK